MIVKCRFYILAHQVLADGFLDVNEVAFIYDHVTGDRSLRDALTGGAKVVWFEMKTGLGAYVVWSPELEAAWNKRLCLNPKD